MKRELLTTERGQVLVLVALSLLVLLGMLALALDGGFAYANRRSAQNAADAGALAGARQLCLGATAAVAEQKAEDYATLNNTADSANAVAAGRFITVTAHITYPTFLAGLLGQENLNTNAVASAGCSKPCEGVGIMPVAWSCSPPITSTEFDDDCNIKYGTETTPGAYYVIMDSKELEEDMYCKEPPNNDYQPDRIDCDLNDDGVNDALASGNRSWLDLDGAGGGSSELVNWINNGFPNEVFIHTWFPGNTGTDGNVFQAAAAKVGKTYKIPLFNAYCKDDPRYDNPDICEFHDGSEAPDYTADNIVVGAGGALYYHVISFSSFKITCVDAPPKPVPEPIPPEKYCPWKKKFIEANPTIFTTEGDIQKLKSIEGYFVESAPSGLYGSCGSGIGGGTYTVYLRR